MRTLVVVVLLVGSTVLYSDAIDVTIKSSVGCINDDGQQKKGGG